MVSTSGAGCRARRWGRSIVAIAALSFGAPAAAQIATDGTAGPERVLAGPNYAIGADLGTRAGGNLFHSFESFSIGTGESATFSGPADIDNVISRVTGGTRSDIDGTLRSTIAGADFFFLNPAGVMFGPGARLEVGGAFHVSTADELRFEDGEVFSAKNPAASSFSVAAPEAFGFLRASPEAITLDRGTLQVPTGETLSIVGGAIAIDGGDGGAASGGEQGLVRAAAGTIHVVSIGGPGAARIADGDVTAGQLADITLINQASIDTSGDGGGTIRIRGGALVASGRSVISADTTGATDGSGGVGVGVDSILATGGSQIRADVTETASGDAGPVIVDAATITLLDAGEIRSETRGAGDATLVEVRADEITISGFDPVLGRLSEIGSEVGRGGTGTGGLVDVEAQRLSLTNGGVISSATFGAGAAGQIRVTATDLTIESQAAIRSSTFATGDAGTITVGAGQVTIDGGGFATGITSEASLSVDEIGQIAPSTGDAGSVRVTADQIEISGAGVIGSNTFGLGDAGDVVVEAGALTIDGQDAAFATGILSEVQAQRLLDGTVLVAEGDAGSVTVRAGQVELRNAGVISSNTLGLGDAGTVLVDADRIDIVGAGETILATGITSDVGAVQDSFGRVVAVGQGAGGDVTVLADELIIQDAGVVQSSTFGPGDAGTVTVDAGVLHLDGPGAAIASEVQAFVDGDDQIRAAGGNAGSLLVRAGEIDLTNGARISSTTFGDGDAGPVTIEADRLGIGSSSAIISEASLVVGPGNEILLVANGNAGAITIDAHRVEIDGPGRVSTSTVGQGDAAPITLVADSIALVGDRAVIASAGLGLGRGGSIDVEAGQLEIDGRGGVAGITSSANSFAAGAGDIDVRARGVTMANGGQISAGTLGASDAGDIHVVAHRLDVLPNALITSATLGRGDAGTVLVEADQVRIDGPGGIESQARPAVLPTGEVIAIPEGNAGPVTVRADVVEIGHSGAISSSTFGKGDAGTVTVEASRLVVADQASITSDSGIFLSAQGEILSIGEGDAGAVLVTADAIELRNRGVISSGTFGPGAGGSVTVDAGSIVVEGDNPFLLTGIASQTFGDGPGGEITITADALTILGNGAISSATFANGHGGSIAVEAGEVAIQGRANGNTGISTQTVSPSSAADAGTIEIVADSVSIGPFAQVVSSAAGDGRAGSVAIYGQQSAAIQHSIISTETAGVGPAGTIKITAPEMMVERAEISSTALGSGPAGNITLGANELQLDGAVALGADEIRLDGTVVSSESQAAGGGQIFLNADKLIDLLASEVTTSVNSDASATAGDISIDPTFLVVDDSRIIANAAGGTGGNIRIVAENLLRSPDSTIEASGAISGTVDIVTQEDTVTDRLVGLNVQPFDVSSLLGERCAARRNVGASSFTGVGRAGLPPSPDGPLTGGYAGARSDAGARSEAGAPATLPGADRTRLVMAPTRVPGALIAVVLPCAGAL